MSQNIIDVIETKQNLLTHKEVCDLMDIKATTFYRFYAKRLTSYRNADRPEDKKKYYDKREVLNILEERTKMPTKVFVERQANEND